MSPHSAHQKIGTALAVTLVVAVEAFIAVPHDGLHEALAQAQAFVATFTGTPLAPLAFSPADWDVQIYHLGKRPPDFPAVIGAEHGADCAGPPATHTVSTQADAVFLCNGHIMTTIDRDYGAIYLTPPQMVDFTSGEGVIRFDLNTDMHSSRDWIEVRVTPYEDNLAHTGLFGQGPPQRGVNFWNFLDGFNAVTLKDFVETRVEGICCPNWGRFLVPSQVRRDTFEFRISRTHIKAWMPAYNQTFIDRDIAPLDWSQGVVQFSEHTYASTKGCVQYNPANQADFDNITSDNCPNTWHWDNISISPAVPFTILKGDRKWVGAEAPVLTLNGPTPPNAKLRFAALGDNIQYSVDNGATWLTAQRANEQGNDPGHWRSYWTPIPAGATTVRFRGTNNEYQWVADGISIFARGGTPGPPATATPTPIPSTTATPTPVPASCELRVRVNGVEQWLTKPMTFCQAGQ